MRRVLSYVMPGRPKFAKVAGSWITDNTALKKTITLCPLCVNKFNPRRYGYVKWDHPILGPFTVADCMDCRSKDPRCSMYIHEEYEKRVMARDGRRGRWVTVIRSHR